VVTCGLVQALLSSKHLPVQHADGGLLSFKVRSETVARSAHEKTSGDSSQNSLQPRPDSRLTTRTEEYVL
jgi:hypothetical protein